MKMFKSILNLKVSDYIEVPGQKMEPRQKGTLFCTAKEVKQVGNRRVVVLRTGKTVPLELSATFKLIEDVPEDPMGNPAPRSQSKTVRGKSIE